MLQLRRKIISGNIWRRSVKGQKLKEMVSFCRGTLTHGLDQMSFQGTQNNRTKMENNL